MKRFRAVVHGRVQRVNFRYYTRQTAQEMNLVGYVRNCWDGTVEVVAEGDPDALRKLISWLHRGPNLAQVSQVEIEWKSPLRDSQRFEVRY
ncbi:MAG: hypothetical protein A2Y73_05975 [Chloroflexi bacterium RBG_13_56_8]|nr:MAG: hypothetical protein A2Y73_05975 [Chloroflexi bacterium RBG_13_56_8]